MVIICIANDDTAGTRQGTTADHEERIISKKHNIGHIAGDIVIEEDGVERDRVELPTKPYNRTLNLVLGDSIHLPSLSADQSTAHPIDSYQALSPMISLPRYLQSDGGSFWRNHQMFLEAVPPTKYHVAYRRSISNSDCVICLRPIKCNAESTWCRARCGNNVHKTCFYTWAVTCTKQAGAVSCREGYETTVTCVHCRADWRWQSTFVETDIDYQAVYEDARI